MPSRRCLLFLSLVVPPPSCLGFHHPWTTVGDQLAASISAGLDDRYSYKPEAQKNWKWLAENYAALALSSFDALNGGDPWNCTGESTRTLGAKLLKGYNPDVKLLWYQQGYNDFTCACCDKPLHAHPEWWFRDDSGQPLVSLGSPSDCEPVVTPQCKVIADFRIKEVCDWWIGLPLYEVDNTADAKRLIDGIFVDGTMYDYHGMNTSARNLTVETYESWFFDGHLACLQTAQDYYNGLNGGEVWGNPLLVYGEIGGGAHPKPVNPKAADYNLTLKHYGGAFDEMFGSFSTMDCGRGENCTGAWDVGSMEESFYAVRNATLLDNKTVIIHTFVGPAYVPIGPVPGSGPVNAQGVHYEPVISASWAGDIKAPWDNVTAMKEAAGEKLVESLAPYLIVASETTFFAYSWFYGLESGYAPCDEDPTLCLAPQGFYPEYAKFLGAPKGLAVQSGTVWTREFEGASVYVDLADRHASRITWHSDDAKAQV